MITGVRGEHNHDNKLMESEVRKIIKTNILQASQNPTATSRTVLKDISSSVLNSNSAAGGLPYVPISKAMAATLQRVRKKEKNYPPIPHKWVDMMIPGSLSVTADGKNYCVMDETFLVLSSNKPGSLFVLSMRTTPSFPVHSSSCLLRSSRFTRWCWTASRDWVSMDLKDSHGL